MPTSSLRAAPRPKQPRTVSLTNPPPTSSQLSHLHTSLSSSTLSLSSLPNVTLENVFVSGADFGVVKYIGYTDFAKRVWLGIELRRPSVLCAHVSYVCTSRTFKKVMEKCIHTPIALSPPLSLSPSLPLFSLPLSLPPSLQE